MSNPFSQGMGPEIAQHRARMKVLASLSRQKLRRLISRCGEKSSHR
jgi:hypothetical protein